MEPQKSAPLHLSYAHHLTTISARFILHSVQNSEKKLCKNNGDEYQRIEYTPYGETWVEKTANTGLEFLPYKFTAKELDEETGLYYSGARYLDPKYSRWLSTDPAFGDYVSKTSKGEGGIYNDINLNLYHYANNSPVSYKDPDGELAINAVAAALLLHRLLERWQSVQHQVLLAM